MNPRDQIPALARKPTLAVRWLAGATSLTTTALGLACPACIPAVAAMLVSLGISIATVERMMQPMLAGLLLGSIGLLAWSAFQHHRWWVVVAGAAGAGSLYAGRYLPFDDLLTNQTLLWSGVLLLVGTSLLNLRFRRACRCCAVTPTPGSTERDAREKNP